MCVLFGISGHSHDYAKIAGAFKHFKSRARRIRSYAKVLKLNKFTLENILWRALSKFEIVLTGCESESEALTIIFGVSLDSYYAVINKDETFWLQELINSGGAEKRLLESLGCYFKCGTQKE